MGFVHRSLGRFRGAIDCEDRALVHFRALGDRTNEAETLTGLGRAHHASGDPEPARAAHRRSLAIWEDLGDPTPHMRSANCSPPCRPPSGPVDRVRERRERNYFGLKSACACRASWATTCPATGSASCPRSPSSAGRPRTGQAGSEPDAQRPPGVAGRAGEGRLRQDRRLTVTNRRTPDGERRLHQAALLQRGMQPLAYAPRFLVDAHSVERHPGEDPQGA
ncbi:tetratricopeptide repeat protein [Streptomyces cinerochromogenes]|uniref:Tetratricopeptide repeat protein n=1 Tax=Streptomyces cinerochromogenes TaxID=66422 RepID=A0ABW7BJ81_9ACTN